MGIEQELSIEYRRLKRHYNFLYKRWNDSVARDLASSLRNWLEMSPVVDEFVQSQHWNLSFSTFDKRKSLNRLVKKHGGERFHLPLGSARKGMQVQEVSTFNSAIDPSIIKEMASKMPNEVSSSTRREYHQLGDWLDVEVSELVSGSKRRGILRKDYIGRVANTLGGSHPINAMDKELKYKDIDAFIADRSKNVINNMPEPYAFLMEAADGILQAFRQNLDRS